jgi:16S rRNA (adenine(1408)-N(1))-methyltransferase
LRLLQGTKVVEAPQAWRNAIEADGRPVVIDLGAGDGRYVYEAARADPDSLYIGIDPDAEGLSEYAYRASRKPSRGGVANALFVVAAVEQLPDELLSMAERVRINYPWGSLMRGLLTPEPETLQQLASLLREGGSFEVLMSYDPEHDTGAFAGPALPLLDEAYLEDVLLPAYEAAGFHVRVHRRLSQDEALRIASTWGRRLLHARPRQVFLLSGVLPTVPMS